MRVEILFVSIDCKNTDFATFQIPKYAKHRNPLAFQIIRIDRCVFTCSQIYIINMR